MVWAASSCNAFATATISSLTIYRTDYKTVIAVDCSVVFEEQHLRRNKSLTTFVIVYVTQIGIYIKLYTVCLKKTSPTFLAVTRESIVGFS